jgi:ABC-type molybdenum transport system ATPase subunit/photorepair protein PhrA
MTAQHEPTEAQRKTVHAMAGYGTPQADIARVIGISIPTLHLHYRRELDVAMAEANVQVARSLFNMAVQDKNTAAAIFWLKARAGWREVAQLDLGAVNGVKVTIEDARDAAPSASAAAEPGST